MRVRVNHLTIPLAPAGRIRPQVRLIAEATAVFLCGAVIVVALGNLFGPAPAVAAALLVYAMGGSFAAYGLVVSYPHDSFGLCNAITLIRLALMSALAAILFAPGMPSAQTEWLAFGIAVLALALDGVDGWAARRAGLSSAFGARFDMEVDSALALLLALLAVDMGHAGLWIIALGLPRYLFVMAGWIWPRLQGQVPDRFSRKVVCVVQIGVLVGLVLPWTPSALATVAGILALIAVVWSFARDILYLTDQRA